MNGCVVQCSMSRPTQNPGPTHTSYQGGILGGILSRMGIAMYCSIASSSSFVSSLSSLNRKHQLVILQRYLTFLTFLTFSDCICCVLKRPLTRLTPLPRLGPPGPITLCSRTCNFPSHGIPMVFHMFQYISICFNIFQYVSICFNMFQYVSICFNIFQYVSIYFNMFQYISICFNMFQYVSICFNMFQYVSICFNIFQYVSIYFNMFQYISICFNMFQYVSICFNMFKYISICFNIFQYVSICFNIFQYVSIYFNMFQYVSICFNMFQYISICFNIFQYVSICFNMFQYVSICFNMFQYISICFNIFQYVSLCFNMFQYVSICFNIFQYVSIYFNMFQYISICFNIFQYVSICFNMFQYVSICFNIFQYVSIYFNMFQYISICFNMFQYVSICFNMFQYVSICFNMFQYVSICFNMFQYVSICFNMFQYISICFNIFQYVSICFNMFQYVSICFNLRLRHSFRPLCFSPSTELRVVLWWQIFVTLCHSTTEPNTKASRADRPTCGTGTQNKSNKSTGCFMVLCPEMSRSWVLYGALSSPLWNRKSSSSVRPDAASVSSEACLPVECLQAPGDSTQPPKGNVENCGNVTDCDSKPHKHMETWWNMSMFPCRKLCWPVLTACSPRVPYFSAQHLRLPDQNTEHITKINGNRWGKMRKDESYGKLWKVMESLRRVKHDWATKQRDNVRTTWGQREDPGSGAGRQASLALARGSWSSWSRPVSDGISLRFSSWSRFSASESVLTFWHVLTFWQLVKSCPHRMSWWRRKAATFCVNDLNTLLSDLLIEMSWNVDVDMTSTWRGRPEQLGSGNARSVPGGMRSHYTPQDKKNIKNT